MFNCNANGNEQNPMSMNHVIHVATMMQWNHVSVTISTTTLGLLNVHAQDMPKNQKSVCSNLFFRDQGTARYNPQNGGYLLLQHSLVGSFRRMPYLPSLKMQPMLAILALGPLECLRTSKASHLFIIKFIGVIRQLLYLFLPDCVVTPVELTLFSSIPLQIYPWSHPIA
jgi:hypothetical protein